MSERVRVFWMAVSGTLILLLIHASIYQRETILGQGDIVVLELAPVDPRSLMQGDYMDLRFAVVPQIREALRSKASQSGAIILALDQNKVGSFVGLDSGEPLKAKQLRLRFRVRDDEVRLATNAFFFQEGTGWRYEAARFGEFRVNEQGDAILTHLRDEDLGRIGKGSFD